MRGPTLFWILAIVFNLVVLARNCRFIAGRGREKSDSIKAIVGTVFLIALIGFDCAVAYVVGLRPPYVLVAKQPKEEKDCITKSWAAPGSPHVPEGEWDIHVINLPEFDGVKIRPEMPYPSYIRIKHKNGIPELMVRDQGGYEIPSELLIELQGGQECILKLGISSESEAEGDNSPLYTPIQRLLFSKETLQGVTMNGSAVVSWIGVKKKTH